MLHSTSCSLVLSSTNFSTSASHALHGFHALSSLDSGKLGSPDFGSGSRSMMKVSADDEHDEVSCSDVLGWLVPRNSKLLVLTKTVHHFEKFLWVLQSELVAVFGDLNPQKQVALTGLKMWACETE